MSHSVFPIKAVNTLFITVYIMLPPWLPKIHDQPSLILRRRSFSRCGIEGIIICFAYKGGQIFFYDCLQPVGGLIAQDSRPTNVDAPLILVLMCSIVNICCRREWYKYIVGLIGCFSGRLRYNPLAKASPVISLHRPFSFYRNWYISLNTTSRWL